MLREYPNIPQEQVAIGQLETAIELWFHKKDMASIHTLASAAQGVLENIARERKIDREQSLEKYLKTKSQFFQDYMRYPRNYFKHGNPKPRGYHPRHAEIVIMDAIATWNDLFGRVSPLNGGFSYLYCPYRQKADALYGPNQGNAS